MDLDTIFYIIAVIVIFIVSLFGQNKKKKNTPVQSDTDEEVYSLNDFEKILQRKEQFRQVVESIENPKLEEDLSEELELEKEQEIKDEQLKKEKLKEEDKKKNTAEKEKSQDGFDLNSAIIYSSILERKKFRH